MILLSGCAKNELSSASSTSKIEVESSSENTLETNENIDVNTIEKNNEKIENVEENCYSEKEIWEEFSKRGFIEDNITTMNFFGEQNPATIYTGYDMNFEFDWDVPVEKDSEEKHPEYHFLYMTGDFEGYDTESQELMIPKLYGGDAYQIWNIKIEGKTWYAQSMGNGFYNIDGDGLAVEKGKCVTIGKWKESDPWGLIVVDCDSIVLASEVPHIEVDKVTHDSLTQLAKTDCKFKGIDINTEN